MLLFSYDCSERDKMKLKVTFDVKNIPFSVSIIVRILLTNKILNCEMPEAETF